MASITLKSYLLLLACLLPCTLQKRNSLCWTWHSSTNKAIYWSYWGHYLFRDSVDRHLETFLNSSFALAGPELQLAIAILVAQTMANRARELNSKLSSSMDNPVLSARLQLLPLALLFCVDAMKNVIRQISRMTLQLRALSNPALWQWAPLWKIPWRIHWDSYREKGVPTPLCTITPLFWFFTSTLHVQSITSSSCHPLQAHPSVADPSPLSPQDLLRSLLHNEGHLRFAPALSRDFSGPLIHSVF